MGLIGQGARGPAGDAHKWRLSKANSYFALCNSYPAVFVVPAAVPDAE